MSLPPSYLGIVGIPHWSDPSALDELTAQCYVYVFVDRRESLNAQLRVKQDIEGLVVLAVKSFILEQQRSNDPVGSRVFQVLRTAVRKAVERNLLIVKQGDSRILDQTVLAPPLAEEAPTTLGDEQIATLASRWAHELLPELITAAGHARVRLDERLIVRLQDLVRNGVEFRFGAILKHLRRLVRDRWRAILRQDLGDWAFAPGKDEADTLATLRRIVSPDAAVNERLSAQRVSKTVSQAIHELDIDHQTRSQLSTLWRLLISCCLEGTGPRTIPSQRWIARELDLPRTRVSALYSILRQLLADAGLPATTAFSDGRQNQTNTDHETAS